MPAELSDISSKVGLYGINDLGSLKDGSLVNVFAKNKGVNNTTSVSPLTNAQLKEQNYGLEVTSVGIFDRGYPESFADWVFAYNKPTTLFRLSDWIGYDNSATYAVASPSENLNIWVSGDTITIDFPLNNKDVPFGAYTNSGRLSNYDKLYMGVYIKKKNENTAFIYTEDGHLDADNNLIDNVGTYSSVIDMYNNGGFCRFNIDTGGVPLTPIVEGVDYPFMIWLIVSPNLFQNNGAMVNWQNVEHRTSSAINFPMEWTEFDAVFKSARFDDCVSLRLYSKEVKKTGNMQNRGFFANFNMGSLTGITYTINYTETWYEQGTELVSRNGSFSIADHTFHLIGNATYITDYEDGATFTCRVVFSADGLTGTHTEDVEFKNSETPPV